MDCKEIHKLLSPFLDNELSARDTFPVAEHLDTCPECQQELTAMQQLDTRLREAGHRPVGGTDELHASVMALCSPRTWNRRWRGLGVAAAAILFLVIGQQLFSAPYDPEARAFSGALTHEIWLNDNSTFSLPWLDPDSLKNILRQEGLTEIPNLSPVGFHLVRARVSRPLRQVFVQLVYRRRSEELSIFVSRRWKRSLSGISHRDGFTIVPLGIRAVFLVSKDRPPNFPDIHQLAEEEINALSA